MSTRGAITRVRGDGFKGVYHHWDSYPEGLGRTLFHLCREQFNSDLDKMLQVLIDQHPAGWSTINGADFSMPPGYVELSKKMKPEGGVREERYGPECYCHGDRHEDGWEVTEKNAAGSGVEWVYAFRDRVMLILASVNEDGGKMIGMFGLGNDNAKWRMVAQIDLNGEEPDWVHIELKNGVKVQ